VCVVAFGLNVISDVHGGGQMRFCATKLHIEAKPNTHLLAAPSRRKGAQGRPSTRSSKLDGCRAEVDDETPKLNIAFPNGSKRYCIFRALTCSGQVAACPGCCTNESMKHDSLEMPARSGAHNKRKTRMEDMDDLLPSRSVKAAPKKFHVLAKLGFLRPTEKDQLTRRSFG
jgi:hypothetical protein